MPVDEDQKNREDKKDHRPAVEIREEKVKDEQLKKWVSIALDDEKAMHESSRALEDEKVPLMTETHVDSNEDRGPFGYWDHREDNAL